MMIPDNRHLKDIYAAMPIAQMAFRHLPFDSIRFDRVAQRKRFSSGPAGIRQLSARVYFGQVRRVRGAAVDDYA